MPTLHESTLMVAGKLNYGLRYLQVKTVNTLKTLRTHPFLLSDHLRYAGLDLHVIGGGGVLGLSRLQWQRQRQGFRGGRR